MKTYKKLNKKNKSKRRYKIKGGMLKSFFSKSKSVHKPNSVNKPTNVNKPKIVNKPKSENVMKCPMCTSDNIKCIKFEGITECRCLDCAYTDDYSDFTK